MELDSSISDSSIFRRPMDHKPLSLEVISVDIPSPVCSVSIDHLQGKRARSFHLFFDIDQPDLVPPYGHFGLVDKIEIGGVPVSGCDCLCHLDMYFGYGRTMVLRDIFKTLEMGRTVFIPIPLPDCLPSLNHEGEFVIPSGCQIYIRSHSIKNIKMYVTIVDGHMPQPPV